MKFLKLFLALAFFTFFLGSVSATVSSGGFWSNNQNSITITNGQSASFTADAGSLQNSMTVSVKIYDSSNNLLYTFENNKQVTGSGYTTYSKVFTVLPSTYQTNGTYTIYITATDSDGSNSYTLTLVVLPSTSPTNHAPVITSTPVTQVNESKPYNYQITATDADNDILTYYMGTSASWLSINPSTGLISGTAPGVNSDTNYNIEVKVSDGTINVSQFYTLTVKDNSTTPVNPDTIPPIVTLKSPVTNYITNSNIVNLKGFVIDNIAISNVSLYIDSSLTQTNFSGVNSANYTFSVSLPDGNYNWFYEAYDTSGNPTISVTRNFIIDTTSPSVSFISNTPLTNSILNSTELPVNVTASDPLSGLKNITVYLYNSSGDIVREASDNAPFSFTMVYLPDGVYHLKATAYDMAGNYASTGTRKITIDTSGNNNQTNQSGNNNFVAASYNYKDVYTGQYEEQLNRTNKGIILTSPETAKPNLTWLWITIVVLLVLMIVATIFILLNINLTNKKGSMR